MKNLGSWGTALVASVALHIVVLGLLLGFRGCGGTETPPPAPPPQTDGRATDLPDAKAAEPTTETKPTDVETKDDVKKSTPGAKKSPTKKPTVKKPEAKPPAKGDKKLAEDLSEGWKSYKVKSGDSLTRIARSCGMTVQELAKANKLSPTANLMLGQTLKIKDVPAEDAATSP